jgi:hypothetical protein
MLIAPDSHCNLEAIDSNKDSLPGDAARYLPWREAIEFQA